jgi:hypothetical protein
MTNRVQDEESILAGGVAASVSVAGTKFLSRAEAATFLTELGLPMSPDTLSTYASKGGGPLFIKYGRTVRYMKEDLLAWVESRVRAKRKSNHVLVDPAAGADLDLDLGLGINE